MSEPVAPAAPAAFYIDSGGSLRPVDADGVGDAEALGWTQATPEQVNDHVLQEKFGTPGQQWAAFSEHALSALTLGGSDWAERSLLPQTAAEAAPREKANPVASGLGTAFGIAAPLALTGGAAGLGELTAPGLIAKAGRAVTGAAERALPAGESLAARIAARAAASGAGSAVEGAFYGLGQDVHEAALGDHDLTAQSILAHVGLGAALGGGLGAAAGTASVAIPAALEKARDAVTMAVGKAQEVYPALAERLTGGAVSADRVREAMTRYSEAFHDPKQVWTMQKDLGGHLEDVANQVADARRELYRAARPAEAAGLIREAGITPVAAQEAAQGVTTTIEKSVREMLADPDKFNPGRAKALQEIADGISRRSADGDAVQIFEELRQARQKVDDLSSWGRSIEDKPYPEQGAIRVARDLRGLVRSAVTDESVWGPAAARQAALDSADSQYREAIKTLSGRGLGPLKSNILPKVTIKGVDEYRINPRALKTFLNQMADPRGEMVSEALTNFLDASGNFTKEMQSSFERAPVAGFDHQALGDLVNRTGDLTAMAKRQASATQLLNELNPDAQFAAGGAKALLPTAGKGGVGEGAGLLAASPFLGPTVGPAAAMYGAFKTGSAVLSTLKNVPQMVATLAKLERINQGVSRSINTGVSTLIRAGTKSSNIARTEAVAGLERVFDQTPSAAQQSFQFRVKEIQKLSANPQNMQDRLADQTKGWHDHAPNTAQALNIASARAVAFLASKIPPQPKPGFLAKPALPSQSDISKFNRYYEAVHDPLIVLKHASSGTLSSEEVEAVSQVYPQLHQKIASAALEKAMTQKDIPYRSRLMLAQLIGHDVDGSTTPSALAINQSAHQAPPQSQGQGQVKPPKMDHMHFAERAMTGPQSLAQPKED